MTSTGQSQNGWDGAGGSAAADEHKQDLLADEPESTGPESATLHSVVERVQHQATIWRDMLSVSIGRARTLTDLEETRIRYFEELGALRPAKSTDQAGASRLYNLSDLRCLYALSLLVKEHGYRPAEAATLVKANRQLIESGKPGSLAKLLQQEGSAITDGFLLARLLSQLIDAARFELNPGWVEPTSPEGQRLVRDTSPAGGGARVVGLLLPMQMLFSRRDEPTAREVQRKGYQLCRNPMKTLVALDRAAVVVPPIAAIPSALNNSGRNDTTVLFYSSEAWEVPQPTNYHYCAYIPENHPERTIMVMVQAPEGTDVPHLLRPRVPARITLFDRILAICEKIFAEFRDTTLVKNYRYRSDGFPIEQTQQTYCDLLGWLKSLIFPEDPHSIAAILLPNSLEQPTSLSILAHHGYDADLAPRIKLDLTGQGQGLCGRAYKLREPFFSQHASSDPRMAYALEERCQVALAVPFTANLGSAPFGVLYLASREPSQKLGSDVAYMAVILANILSEQIGRWWLTRLRKTLDLQLHQHVDAMVRWFDSLDEHGADFEQALAELQRISSTIGTDAGPALDDSLVLVVFDIDKFRQQVQIRSNAPVPLKAQMHVRKAILKIVPKAQDYWFKNDHALLILRNDDAVNAVSIVRRIASQVRALPADIQAEDNKNVTITVSAAIKPMTYQDLADLDSPGGDSFRLQMAAIIDDLRQQISQTPTHTIMRFTPQGWMPV